MQGDNKYLAEAPVSFEDGTVDYLNLAVEIGLKHHESSGSELIHERVRCLTGWLLDNLFLGILTCLHILIQTS
jgi:selenocysteine lyase/cysteine desulfurase